NHRGSQAAPHATSVRISPLHRAGRRREGRARLCASGAVGWGGALRGGGYALARVFPGVTLAAPADGVRMLLCPSSHRTRTRGGSSWSTSSITPARLGCISFSDSTTILSQA